ncbi:zinc-dependent alcohol dehydrogenase family protein [Glacieibacterium frigidum]|uniref:NAD(P)-dependent alcohol dehydrogenase n=1 Tax=Glacieibacterium frigidum TaxID=2593303 RepID=A0A552U8A3_9SPHN|nr:NAD(P)-dependent alcohol dehydrogenase [Glacieibacterium frigidum]TRW14442.1 NAD(P)-dependent alcohol dehydrogenase [Glacieibacterium frigidum]
MRAYQIGPQTGLASLTATTRPDPVAGPGEVVLKVRLVGLNHRDLLVLEGTYGARRPEDRIPMSEGIGEVVAVGEGVTTVKPGDRAIFAHFVTWLDGDFSPSAFATDLGITHDGWLAEQIKVPGVALMPVPDAVSDEQAILASAALTAWHALVEVGAMKPGDLVLALGTGGVSIYALKIAKAAGARVAITSSSDAKLDLARSLGADICINYRTTPDWAAELLAQTGGKGADIIVETGGQATLSQSITASAANARIVLIGGLGGAATSGLPNFGTIIGKNLTIKGIAEGSRAMLVRLLRAVETSGIAPVVDKVFGFDEAPAAYAYLKGGAHVGKVLIKLD